MKVVLRLLPPVPILIIQCNRSIFSCRRWYTEYNSLSNLDLGYWILFCCRKYLHVHILILTRTAPLSLIKCAQMPLSEQRNHQVVPLPLLHRQKSPRRTVFQRPWGLHLEGKPLAEGPIYNLTDVLSEAEAKLPCINAGALRL